MKTYLTLYILSFTIITVFCVKYNERCTFSFDTCNWSIGRRWKIRDLNDEFDDKVLIAIAGNKEDNRMGFTDTITSSWLYLTPSCSFDIRLTFQFSIENEQDRLEVFLIKNNGARISSIGRWKAITNENINSSTKVIETLWQQAVITFRAAEEFRIDIEVRHLPDTKNNSNTWFAIDDILIESCPKIRVYTTSTTRQTTVTTTTPPWTTRSYLNISNSIISKRPFFRWKFNDSSVLSSTNAALPSSPRLTLLTFMLYLSFTIVTLILLIVFLVIIIFTCRKHCLRPATVIDHRYRSSRKRKTNHRTDHIDQDTRTEKTMITTIRPYH